MESVDDYNVRKRKERKEREDARSKTGVACPKCEGELRWEFRGGYASIQFPPPTKQTARCKICQLTVELEM